MAIETVTNLDYLIDQLRLWIGDTNPLSQRYSDSWLRTSLVGSVKALRAWWRDKYLIDDTTYNVSRNSGRSYLFEYGEPPIVDHRDEMPIILMASIIIKSGSLQNAAWDLVSWRDFEVSVSSQEVGSTLKISLQRDWDLLKDYLVAPTRHLAGSRKRSLIGYGKNSYERNINDPL